MCKSELLNGDDVTITHTVIHNPVRIEFSDILLRNIVIISIISIDLVNVCQISLCFHIVYELFLPL